MLKWWGVVIAVSLGSTAAAADSIEVLIGPEIRSHLNKPDTSPDMLEDGASTDDTVGALVATLAYRLSDQFSVGLHGGVARRSYSTAENGNMRSFHTHFSTVPIDIAFTGQLTVAARFWVAPWVGVHLTSLHTTDRYCHRIPSDPGPWPCDTSTTDDWVADPSVGITAGVNIWCHGMHCVAGLVDLQAGGVADYAAVSFGLAYHL